MLDTAPIKARLAAKNAGFPRVEIDPEHAIALIAEVERLRAAIATHRDDCRREYGGRPDDHSPQDAALWAVLV